MTCRREKKETCTEMRLEEEDDDMLADMENNTHDIKVLTLGGKE